jgi:alkylhydroperoxidase/carboxymuconolactone decarboxylase family protein YurZ
VRIEELPVENSVTRAELSALITQLAFTQAFPVAITASAIANAMIGLLGENRPVSGNP